MLRGWDKGAMRLLSGLMLFTSAALFVLILSGASPRFTDHSAQFRAQLNLCLRVLNHPAFMSEEGRTILTDRCTDRAEVGKNLWGTASHAEVVRAFLLTQEGQPEAAAVHLIRSRSLDPVSHWLASLRVAIWDLLDSNGLDRPCDYPAFRADLVAIARVAPSSAQQRTVC
jgi:hypothetical protein